MEMESALFIQNLKDPNLITLVSENIGRIGSGSSSHCAGALKLGLKKGVEFKRQNKGVLVRCPRSGCARYTTPVSYSVLGGGLFCTYCSQTHANYYMLCAGCGRNRNGHYTSCPGCTKRFA